MFKKTDEKNKVKHKTTVGGVTNKVGKSLMAKTRLLRPPYIWLLVATVSVVLIVWAVQQINYYNQQQHEQKTQLNRLNAAADDLKKVYDQLLTTLPNIKEHSFERSCNKSSDVLNNGTISCGGRIHLTIDGIVNDDFHKQFYDLVQNFLQHQFFIHGNVSVNTEFRDSQLQTQKMITTDGVICSVSAEYFATKNLYQKWINSERVASYSDGIVSADVRCFEITPRFLPGYVVE